MNNLCFMTNLTPSDIAQWVQGVGTLLAAVLAYAAIASEQKRAREDRRRREVGWLLALAQIAVRISEFIEHANKSFGTIEEARFYCTKGFNEELFNELTNTLSQFSVIDAPGDGLIKDLLTLKIASLKLKKTIDKVGGLVAIENQTWQLEARALSALAHQTKTSYEHIEQAATDANNNTGG